MDPLSFLLLRPVHCSSADPRCAVYCLRRGAHSLSSSRLALFSFYRTSICSSIFHPLWRGVSKLSAGGPVGSAGMCLFSKPPASGALRLACFESDTKRQQNNKFWHMRKPSELTTLQYKTEFCSAGIPSAPKQTSRPTAGTSSCYCLDTVNRNRAFVCTLHS